MQINMEAMAAHAEQASALLKNLSNQNRLMVVCLLSEGEKAVSELQAELPLSQSALSQHLARLRDQGIVETRREAQVIYYRLLDENAAAVIHCLHDRFCGAGA